MNRITSYLRPLRVLVADDCHDVADSLGMLLEIVGCEVQICYDGVSVARTVEGFEPAVCLLDVRMPGVDGWEVARRLRSACGNRPLLLIAITGMDTKLSASVSKDAGFDHHLVKPADPQEVFKLMGEFVLGCPMVITS
jgi:CheY-like chemotaxis protein